jgi:hypothetical protein
VVDRLKGLIDSCCATGCLSGIRDYDINASMGLSKSVDVQPGAGGSFLDPKPNGLIVSSNYVYIIYTVYIYI